VNTIALAWTASTDNVGVTAYRVHRGTTYVGTTGMTSCTDTSLSPNTTYGYTVKRRPLIEAVLLPVASKATTRYESVPVGAFWST
jgi:hypothetical protein